MRPLGKTLRSEPCKRRQRHLKLLSSCRLPLNSPEPFSEAQAGPSFLEGPLRLFMPVQGFAERSFEFAIPFEQPTTSFGECPNNGPFGSLRVPTNEIDNNLGFSQPTGMDIRLDQ